MGGRRLAAGGGLRLGAPAAAAALVMTVAAGGAQAGAARAPGQPGRAGPAGIISTIAGGPGGPAKATLVALTPFDVSSGNGGLYVAADNVVHLVSAATGMLTTPVGTGSLVPLGDGHPATRAALSSPGGTALDGAGNLVITDAGESRVRVVAARTGTFYGHAMTAGDIYTVAGNGTQGFAGDGGPATQAELGVAAGLTAGVAVDGAGNLLIADVGNNRVRLVVAATGTFYGQAMTAGDIYTVAGGGTGGLGDGGPATAAQLDGPADVAVDGDGNLVITDTRDNRVRVVAAATSTFYGQAMTAGDIYTVAGTGTFGFSGDGGPATAAGLGNPAGTSVDGAGNLVIADTHDDRVRVVAASTGRFYGRSMTAGHIYTVAGGGIGLSGDGGPARTAAVDLPQAVTTDANGNLAIADTGSRRVRVLAESTGSFYGRAMTAGNIYTVAGTGGFRYSGDGGPATAAELDFPSGVAADGAGNAVIADIDNNRVRVVAASTGSFYRRAMTAGDIYTVVGTGTRGFTGDGGPARSAELSDPVDVAVDGSGNLVIADGTNFRIRVVAARAGTFYGQAMTAGDIYTVAGDGSPADAGDGGPATAAGMNPQGIGVDGGGNLLIAEPNGQRVRMVAVRTGTFYGQAMTAGDIYTVAGTGTRGFTGDGGPATRAELGYPNDVTVDAAGNMVIADNDNNRMRVVAASTGTFYGQAMTAGDIYTVAGRRGGGFSGDGGPATSAKLNGPEGVAADGAGNLVIADTGNERIRVVAAATGTFYGRAMTAGDIYTVAGNGHLGYGGDGHPAVKAPLCGPPEAAVTGAGSLLIVDQCNSRIRAVTG